MTRDEEDAADLAADALPAVPEGVIEGRNGISPGLRRRLARGVAVDQHDATTNLDDDGLGPSRPDENDTLTLPDSDESSTVAIAGPVIGEKALPEARRYAAERWLELTSTDTPWFARSDGIGVRLRLRELLDTARARGEGATFDKQVNEFRQQARQVLWQTQAFLKRRHPAIAKHLSDALTDKEASLPTGGIDYSTVAAALHELDGAHLRQALIQDLGACIAEATTVDGLRAIDEPLELLDAELAYDGFSREWRHTVARDFRDRITLDVDTDAATSVREAIEHHADGWPRNMRFIIPVNVTRPRKQEAFSGLLDADDLSGQLAREALAIPTTTRVKLGTHAYDKVIEQAADSAAGLARANEWIEQEVALYRLQGGDMDVLPVWLSIAPDDERIVEDADRPEPLWLLPDDLTQLRSMLGAEPARAAGSNVAMADAFIQLAQARASVSGPALSDLWTVTEAVFGGVALDSGINAGEVMAGLLSYLYPLALLDWMGQRLIALHVPYAGIESRAAWALSQFETNAKVAFGVLQGDADPLLYVRASQFGHWGPTDEPSTVLTSDLKRIYERCLRIAERAYLVRNFHVHRGQPYRATALAATLPVFAELVRQALGYIARDDERREKPIIAAKIAAMRIDQAATDYAAAGNGGGGPLRRALRDDLTP